MAIDRTRNKLSAASLRAAAPGKYNDGQGLWLHKRTPVDGRWFFRYTTHEGRREMGLGTLADVSLKLARDRADQCRRQIGQGLDPIEERNKARRRSPQLSTTLRKIAEEAFEARKPELREDGRAGRWYSPVELHVLPCLGDISVTDLDQVQIRDALAPIWETKPVAASKAINRLRIILDYAAAKGLAVDQNATKKAKALLGKQRHVPEHVPSMDWRDVPKFYGSLNEPTVTHLALRLLILTGHRSKPLRFLRLEHIQDNVWTAPAELMKGKQGSSVEFRCHLSTEALKVIELAKPLSRDGYLFPSAVKGVLSDATLSRLMERRGLIARPHGFRTTMRVWLETEATARYEVMETMLQHKVGGLVERAYRRTDYLDQRRPLYEKWADWVTSRAVKV